MQMKKIYLNRYFFCYFSQSSWLWTELYFSDSVQSLLNVFDTLNTSVTLRADTFVCPTVLKASITPNQNLNILDWNKYLQLI